MAPTAAQAAHAASAVTPPAPAAPATLAEHSLALESLGRARPQEASARLDDLIAGTPPFSLQRLGLLTVQGLMHAEAAQGEAAERSALQLDAWREMPGADGGAQAAASALLIRGSFAAHGGHDLQRADALLLEAMLLLPADVPPQDRFRFVATHGFIKDRAAQLEAAVRLNHEALAIADRVGPGWRRAEARSALAYSYYSARQLERARSLSEEALAVATEAGDWVAMGRAYSAAGMVLDSLGDREGDRRAFERAIDCARRAGAKRDEARYLANSADHYLKNNDPKTALAHAQRALPLARELRDPDTELVALANIGFALIAMQQTALGKRHVEQAIAIDEQRGAMAGAAASHLELGQSLEKAGDLQGAVAAYHRHRVLEAGVLRGDQQKAILAMQEQYDAEQRSRSLALLQREQQITAEQLRRRDLQQRLWWLLAAALLLSFGVLVALQRRVRQANRQLAASNRVLQQHGERDPLTGLANRRGLQSAMQRRAADGRLEGTLYLIDIDHFKRINDLHGHAAGDAVLVEITQRLRATLREHDLVARWGGEEFLVVVQALSPERIDALARRMLGALQAAPVQLERQAIAVTASIGFATFPVGPGGLPVPWERALRLVDTAMYLAKAHGRNRAYGVRLRQAANDDTLDAIAGGLEAAAEDGRVDLTLLHAEPAPAVRKEAMR